MFKPTSLHVLLYVVSACYPLLWLHWYLHCGVQPPIHSVPTQKWVVIKCNPSSARTYQCLNTLLISQAFWIHTNTMREDQQWCTARQSGTTIFNKYSLISLQLGAALHPTPWKPDGKGVTNKQMKVTLSEEQTGRNWTNCRIWTWLVRRRTGDSCRWGVVEPLESKLENTENNMDWFYTLASERTSRFPLMWESVSLIKPTDYTQHRPHQKICLCSPL